MMDANSLLSGEEYEKLPESVVIFMTETDVLKMKKPIYVIHRTIDGTGQIFHDGTTIIYVNCAYQDESTPLGKLVHNFRCTSPNEMYYAELANRVRYFKEEPKGVAQMSGVIEKVAEDRAKKEVERSTLRSIRALMETLHVTAEKAMELLKIDKSMWKKYLALL